MTASCLNAMADSPARSLNVSHVSNIFPSVLVQTPPLLSCEVCVIVPVRNEADHLWDTLTALATQIDLQGQPLAPSRYEIIVLANNCTDASAAIARQFAQQHPACELHIVEWTFPAEDAYIGRVRQLLMDEAYRRLVSIGRQGGVIASTDGDSQVAPTWIAATLYEIDKGADAVGGRIITDRSDRAVLNAYARACFLREVGYCTLIAELEDYLDPDPFDRSPRHHQHYGASLAVTAEMYALAGGMPAVRTPEDVAFYRALQRVGARFRHSPLVRVTTSARQTGRTSVGLANQLHTWTTMAQQQQPFLVESAHAVEVRLHMRHGLRREWQRCQRDEPIAERDLLQLSKQLGVSLDWLQDQLVQSSGFGLLWQQVERYLNTENRWPLVRIEEAIADLRLRLHHLRHLDIRSNRSRR